MVMIIGHKNPYYLIDTAESINHYNKDANYEIVFAVDFCTETAKILRSKYGKNRVFLSDKANGWGRGILRTLIYALDYFNPFNYFDVITMDSDALCVGPFINQMVEKADTADVFFTGAIWYSPSHDHEHHFSLRDSGFMIEYPFNFKTEMAAGPCMLWSGHCFKFMKQVGLQPASEFDKKYHLIHFAHDQLSTYFNSCGVGRINRIGPIMEIKWRDALPTFKSVTWGNIPITHPQTAIIHPTNSKIYSEDQCRGYFKNKRNYFDLL